MKILVAHPGTQHAHHLVSGFIKAGVDVSYHTIMQFGRNNGWQHFLPRRIIGKRKLNDINDKVIVRYPFLEGIPAILRSFNGDQRAYASRNNMFQKRLSLKSIKGSSSVIGFDSSSLLLAKTCRQEGIPFFLELTTPHALEKQKWSEYVRHNFPLWPSGILQKPKDLIDDEDEEVEIATVVSAPSKYVAETHYKHSDTQKRIVINPYGADLSVFGPKASYRKSVPKFVFMGAINAAKGLPVLLQAWSMAKPDATLTLAGHGDLPAGVKLPEGVEFVGRISKHTRHEFLQSADVFICPSLYEGLALVQLEAAACGLAVIGTHNSGGGEFLEEGSSGFFVDAGNPTALAARITRLAADADLRETMGRKASIRAQQYSWDAYTMRWLQLITRTLTEQHRLLQ